MIGGNTAGAPIFVAYQAALKEMEHDPFAGGDVARLHDQPTAFRRRVGDWRIFFDMDPQQRLVMGVSSSSPSRSRFGHRSC